MKYLVDKKKLINFLQTRPAMLAKVNNLTEDFCVELFFKEDKGYHRRKFEDLYRRIPANLKTVRVTKAFLKTSPYFWGANKDIIPVEHLSHLNKKEREQLIGSNFSFIYSLPNPTPDEWIKVLKSHTSAAKDVPANAWTIEMYESLVEGESSNNLPDIPEENWSIDWARRLVRLNKYCLSSVPAKYITNDVLALGIEQDLTKINNIPETSWDRDLAKKAIEYQSDNYFVIPQTLLTRAETVEAARHGLDWWRLPEKERDYDLLVVYCSESHRAFNGDEPRLIREVKKLIPDKKQFVLDVLKAGSDDLYVFDNLNIDIPSEWWPDMIEAKPALIRRVEKANQTTEIVERFITTASTETKDQYDNFINLGKITEQMVPFLINCNSALLQETMRKFLKGNDTNTVTDTTMEIDIAPSEYAKLRSTLN